MRGRPAVLYVYYATFGTAGAYVAALAEAFRGLPVDATFAVSAYYRFPTAGLPPNVRVWRHFFRLTENVPENPHAMVVRGVLAPIRRLVRVLELSAGYLRLLAYIVRHRVDVVNLSLIDDFAPTWLFARAVRLLHRQLYVTAHDVIAHDRPDMPRSRRDLFAHADRIVVHGEHVAAQLAVQGGVPRAKIAMHVFPWCDVRPVLDPERLAEARRAIPAESERVVLLAPGYIRQTKGFDRLVDAWMAGAAGRTSLRLVVAGDPAREVWRDLNRLRGAAGVRIEARRLTDEELQVQLERADLIVLPYRDYAHSSVHLNAYLSAERPVLGSDIALFRADLTDDSGFVAPGEPPEAFARAIERAAALGREELRAMGRRGRERLLTRATRLPAELRALYLS